jgi:hypothetical protein
MSIPTDLIAEAGMVGAEQDAMMQQMQEQITPQGKFSKNALNRLVKELNVVLEMFQQTYPEFEEDITIFPEEFVTSLSMVKSAADDAGVDFEINMEEISDDRDLAMVAGQLRKLSKDKTLKKFLEANTLMPEEEVVEEEVVTEEPVDMDAMFAGRM